MEEIGYGKVSVLDTYGYDNDIWGTIKDRVIFDQVSECELNTDII
jgi:hypothetical protein